MAAVLPVTEKELSPEVDSKFVDAGHEAVVEARCVARCDEPELGLSDGHDWTRAWA